MHSFLEIVEIGVGVGQVLVDISSDLQIKVNADRGVLEDEMLLGQILEGWGREERHNRLDAE